jgi:hypothetical protein
VILFKPDMVPMILAGTKTVTRRRGKRRWRERAEHLCYTRPPFARSPGEPFARVRIVSVCPESRPGGPLAEALAESWPNCPTILECLRQEAKREGFGTWGGFTTKYQQINGAVAISEPCWRVEFELVKIGEGQ